MLVKSNVHLHVGVHDVRLAILEQVCSEFLQGHTKMLVLARIMKSMSGARSMANPRQMWYYFVAVAQGDSFTIHRRPAE